jgi:photosystem II stability/assembly factor-like uncharacterized protein
MTREHRAFLGTRRGVFTLRSQDGRCSWQLDAPALPGYEINHVAADPRDPLRVYATANHAVWGPQIQISRDGGRSWTAAAQSPAFAPDDGRAVKSLWFIRPGHAAHPGEVWCGVEPAALFRSTDWGDTWTLMPALTEHPTASLWQPGGAGLILHGIVLDPLRPNSLIATISAGGAYRSDDGGVSWQPINAGVRAGFLPESEAQPPAGHCVHKLVRTAGADSLLFQQNHCGAYASEDEGASWREVTDGLPSEFGFPAAAHPHAPRTVYVAPLVGDSFRAFADGAVTVWRSQDGGGNWEPLCNGLPRRDAYLAALRAAMTTDTEDDAGIYLGSSTGQLFFSPNSGDAWREIGNHLPPVLSVDASAA